MLRLTLAMLLVVSMGFAVVGCGDDEPAIPDVPDVPAAPAVPDAPPAE